MYALPSGGLNVSGTIAKLWNQYLTGFMRATRFIRVDSSAKMHISTAGDGSIVGAGTRVEGRAQDLPFP